MSEMQNKSRSNKTAAGLLISSKEYAPSVHCSYYSFLQMAQHVILEREGKTMNDLITEQSAGKSRPTSHIAIRFALKEMIKKSARLELPSFIKKFEILKQLRQDSDYGFVSITLDDAEKARTGSDDLKSLILNIK